MSNDLWEQGFLEGKQIGFTHGFNSGFWSAILLIAGVVMGGLLVMRVM